MAQFELLQVEARTGNVEASLPMTSLQYGDTLNQAGSSTMAIPLSVADPAKLIPGRSALVVLRDGEPDWGGLMWSATADLAAGTLTMGASGWHSYYTRAYLVVFEMQPDRPLFGRWRGYKATKDQALLLRDWLQWTDGGIDTDTSWITTTGRIRTRDWGFAECKSVAEAINELADDDGGFNFRYETYWKARGRLIGNRFLHSTRLKTSFPTLTHGSNAEVSQVSYDGTKLASIAWVFGADDGTGGKPYQRALNELDAPYLAQVATYSDIKSVDALTPKANALAAVGRKPIALPTLTLYPDVYDPAQFMPGAVGRVKVDSGYVNLSDQFVITERRIDVDVNGRETVSLSLANKDVFVSGDSV
ncbi:hypothetical protein ABZV65_04200 [Streptomyces bauhiniae]|uniref:hypothetical protein n=1 Tax=Streptomyces bauhiniae TaxID=2340725 RepID=UPI0033BDD398